jgi:hypothetical protein
MFKNKKILSNVFSIEWWVGIGVQYCNLLIYFVEADKNSVRQGGWAVRWHF